MEAWLFEYKDWVTDEDEALAYAEHFLEDYLPRLPFELKGLILVKYWSHRYKKARPFGFTHTPRKHKVALTNCSHNCQK